MFLKSILQEREDPEYAVSLKREENDYLKKKMAMQIRYGKKKRKTVLF